MELTNLIDTFLNIGVFVFIGLLVWLYFRKESDSNQADSNRGDRES